MSSSRRAYPAFYDWAHNGGLDDATWEITRGQARGLFTVVEDQLEQSRRNEWDYASWRDYWCGKEGREVPNSSFRPQTEIAADEIQVDCNKELRDHRSTDAWDALVFRAEAAEARVARLEQALRRVAEHPILSTDDPCDWHCTRQMKDLAVAALELAS